VGKIVLDPETFKVLATGATHEAEWVWVVQVRNGRIDRITHIQDLSGISEHVAQAAERARSTASTAG
jgi:ketosteroid isomerase-like protein